MDKAGQWGYCLLPSLGPNSGNCINTSLYNNASLTEQSPYCGRPHSSPSYKNSSLFRRRGLFFLSFSQAHGLRASLNFRCELAQTFRSLYIHLPSLTSSLFTRRQRQVALAYKNLQISLTFQFLKLIASKPAFLCGLFLFNSLQNNTVSVHSPCIHHAFLVHIPYGACCLPPIGLCGSNTNFCFEVQSFS